MQRPKTLFRAVAFALSALALTTWHGTAHADDSQRMRLAAEQLISAQLPSGLFAYDFDFATGSATSMEPMSSPNLVRQTATAHVLARYREQVTDQELGQALDAALVSALGAFQRHSLPFSRTTFQRAVQQTRILSLPYGRETLQGVMNALGLLYSADGEGRVVSPDRSYESAWLGATALALLTELEYFRNSRGHDFTAARGRWRDAILDLRNPGGAFRAAPHFLGEESYFNGESWLALAVYAETFPNDHATRAELELLDEHLLARYGDSPRPRFFHWGTQAAAVRYRSTGDIQFRDFVMAQAAHFLPEAEEALAENGEVSCAKLEGFATAARLLEKEQKRTAEQEALSLRLRRLIDPAMEANRSLQIQPGQQSIALPEGASLSSPHLAEFAGAFLESRDEPVVRIDLTGHCLLAMMILSEPN